MNASRWTALGLLLTGVACSGAPRARYQETRIERAQAPVADEVPFERFDIYSDEAADEWLTRRVAEAIEAEIRRRDAERQRREAEERRRAEQVRREIVYRDERYPRYRYAHRPGPAWYLPWNTAIYGGLGAIIGHQSGHRDRGFAIGASLGLMHDLLRWRW